MPWTGEMGDCGSVRRGTHGDPRGLLAGRFDMCRKWGVGGSAAGADGTGASEMGRDALGVVLEGKWQNTGQGEGCDDRTAMASLPPARKTAVPSGFAEANTLNREGPAVRGALG